MDAQTQAAFDMLRELVDHRSDRVEQRFEQIDQRFEQVDRRFEQVDRRFEQVDRRFEQIDRRFEQVEPRLDALDRHAIVADQRLERLEVASVVLRQRVDATAAETRREFHVVAESLRGDIRLLAEGFTLRIDRLEATLQDQIARVHGELSTLMRVGYSDLDRRVTALERRPRDAT